MTAPAWIDPPRLPWSLRLLVKAVLLLGALALAALAGLLFALSD